jgi:NADH-quinone oxidoreductase subunit G
MPQVTIDGKKIEVDEGYSVIQACEMAGVEIPHFCYHERLKIAGNCRMCLVEIEKSPKPVASCAMPISDGMVIHTNTPKVQQAREGVMEFLLINHPLDCPICDQGGECDLQDQAFKYGKNLSRFKENKRAVKDKNMGPLVRTHMTRCIHCTRCIRFATDIAGIEEIGTIGRGEHMEVSTYLEKSITSELSGNLIDICPVGALTSKPYEFKYRSWELRKSRSIDVFDAMGSNVRIDSKGMEIIRILPETNDDINDDWISDKGRFSYDGLKYQRLDRPYLRVNGKLQEVSWTKAFEALSDKLKTLPASSISAICGNMVDCESIFMLKTLFESLGCDNIDGNQFDYNYDTNARANYLFNTTIAGIDKADFCLLIGANPRHNAPVLNSRIGRNQREGKLHIARIGEVDDQTYKIQELGDSLLMLNEILSGTHPICARLALSKNPMLIIGDAVLAREDAHSIISLAHAIGAKYGFLRQDWNGINTLHNDSASVGLLDLKFRPRDTGKNFKQILSAAKSGDIKLVYLLAADEFNMDELGEAFVVYQGHHGDKGANRADLILPGCAYTEKNGIYVNLEGRPQYSYKIVDPYNLAKDDRDIFIELSNLLGFNCPFNTLDDIRAKMCELFPIFQQINTVIPSDIQPLALSLAISDKPLQKIEVNYYMNNPISRASKTMLNCTKFILEQA